MIAQILQIWWLAPFPIEIVVSSRGDIRGLEVARRAALPVHVLPKSNTPLPIQSNARFGEPPPDGRTPDLAAQGQSVIRKIGVDVPLTGLTFCGTGARAS